MKIKRSVVVQIIKEELARLIEKPVVTDAHEDKKGKEEKDGAGEKKKVEPHARVGNGGSNMAPKTGGKEQPPGAGEPKELPVEKDPADAKLDKTGPEEEDEAESDAKSDISDELTGKTVQSIVAEPKSKLLPGAQEIVISFDQITEPLRILVTKSGAISYYFKGLHNQL